MKSFYEQRIKVIEATLNMLKQKRNRIAWLRFISFSAIPVLFFSLADISILVAIFSALISLFTLLFFVITDIKNNHKIASKEQLLIINLQELKSLNSDNTAFNSGIEFSESKHAYAVDLDVFGDSSLYQMFCRATTNEGKSKLASALMQPQPYDLIKPRQDAITELSGNIDFLQDLRSDGLLYTSKGYLLDGLFKWFGTQENWQNSILLRLSVNFLPYFTIASAILWGFGILNGLFVILILLHLLIYTLFGKNLNQLHSTVSKVDTEMKSYSQLLSHVEKKKFNSPYLKELQQELKINSHQPSQLMNQFAKLVERMDYRMNILFLMTIGLITFWDFRIAFKLIDWKQHYAGSVQKWMDVVAEFESLSSFATIKFNYPDWIFPTVTNNYFELAAINIGHPLISAEKRINNDISIAEKETLLLLTGSNMAGKSTLLRTLGTNMVLAFAGAPVCAANLRVSYVPILSSMRINDSLAENTSSFYAEIKRLGAIVETVNSGSKPFLLLDEILRGTNSNDRHLGSEALINLLIGKRVATIISTHDLQLTSLSEKYPRQFVNYHFDAQVNNVDELYFDYKIKKGICQSLNASILMRKIGLNV